MNDGLSDPYEALVEEQLGYAGRLLSWSKSGFMRAHPDHVPIFNGNLCLAGGKIWYGDVDLTVDEPALLTISAQIGEIVYLLHEHDARFKHEAAPLLGRAVYSVTPSRHTRYRFEYIERAKDGTLRQRPPDPESLRRWRWGVLKHRPRLWRFWRLELVREETQRSVSAGGTVTEMTRAVRGRRRRPPRPTTTLLYLGRDASAPRPFLVLAWHRGRERLCRQQLEWTWYPAQAGRRFAPRPLIKIIRPRPGRLTFFLRVAIWPACMYELQLGYHWERRCE